MPNTLIFTCGNNVQSMGTNHREICDMLSTLAPTTITSAIATRGKAAVLPIFINYHSTKLSTAVSTLFNPLHRHLSPLSTVPITTRTKERIER